MSTTASTLFKRNPILYLVRTAAFLSIYVSCSILINGIQFWGLSLYLLSRDYYRNYMRFTQRLFGILIVIVTFIFSPLQIVLTGEHSGLNQESFVPIMVKMIIVNFEYIYLFVGKSSNLYRLVVYLDNVSIQRCSWGAENHIKRKH